MPTFHCMSLWEWGHCYCGSRHCASYIPLCSVFRRENPQHYSFLKIIHITPRCTSFFSYIPSPCPPNLSWVIHYFPAVSITDTWTETQVTNWVHHMCHTDAQVALIWRDGMKNGQQGVWWRHGRILITQHSKYTPAFIIKHNFLAHQSLSWHATPTLKTTVRQLFVLCIFFVWLYALYPWPYDFLVSVVNPVPRWWPSHTQQIKRILPVMAL